MSIFGVVQQDGSIKNWHPHADEFQPTCKKVYVIDGGDTFEGTEEQFEDCFGGPATEYAIRDFCHKKGWSLKIVYL